MNFSGDNQILLLILLFVFMGGNSFDVTQLLLTLALFSTICPGCGCSGAATA